MNERNKNRQLQIGVALVMAAVLLFWFLNLSNSWRIPDNRSASERDNWQQFRNDFNRTLGNLQANLNTMSAERQKEKEAAERAFISDLVKNTASLASSSASSSLEATTTATSTLKSDEASQEE